MDDILYQLNFIEYLNDVMNTNYKSERFIRFIKDFDDMWKEKKYMFPEDGIHRIWGTKLVVDDNMEIKKLLWDPFYLKINDFFESRNKQYLNEITEEDLIDLTLYEGIGKVKYFMLMKLLFGESNVRFDYKINSDNINNVNNISPNFKDKSEIKPINNTDEILDKSITSIYESLEDIKNHCALKAEEHSQQYSLEKEKNNDLETKLKTKEAELVNLKLEFESEKANNKEQIRDLLIDISDTYERKKEVEKELVQSIEKNNYLDNEIKKKINELLEKESIIINLQSELEIKNNEITELQNREIKYVNEIEKHKQTITEFSSLKGMVEHILDKFRKNTQSND